MNDQSVYWNNGETRLLFTTWFGVKQAAMRNIEEISIFLLTFLPKKKFFTLNFKESSFNHIGNPIWIVDDKKGSSRHPHWRLLGFFINYFLTHAGWTSVVIYHVVLPFPGPPFLHGCSDSIVERNMAVVWTRQCWMHAREIVSLKNDFIVCSTIY